MCGVPENGFKNGHGNGAYANYGKANGFSHSQYSSPTTKGRFSIRLSVVFLLLAFALSSLIAFSIGWIARLILLSHFGLIDEVVLPSTSLAVPPLSTGRGMSKKQLISSSVGQQLALQDPSTTGNGKKSQQLPSPIVIDGKDVPFTTYASKTFQMAGAATSNTLHIDRSTALIMTKSRKEFDGGPDFSTHDEGGGEGGGIESGEGWEHIPCEEKACSRGKEREDTSLNESDGHNDDSDGLHLPAGQHLLVDIKDVDSNFLNSEERLATAMIELINESKLTLLSYHCHSLVPIGVSCAGVLLESHVAFHTWPMEGVITLDLFTCGGGLLIPTLPSIERLFGVPGTPNVEEGETGEDVPAPTLLWSHKLRGFREGFAAGYVRSKNPLDGSLGRYVLGKLDFDLKRPLLSTKTAVHSVNIYEVMEPRRRDVNSYVKSLSPSSLGEEEGYESYHPEQFGPDKILFLDGIIQSTLYGDAPYHESIVHPAMLTHANPKRVAIIGGGEGATLREVLKYKSVEEVIILELDEGLVGICSIHMPEWSDCSDLEGSDDASCFGDSRAKMLYVDAFRWFVDTFGNGGGGDGEEKFDVIIMDALDPSTSVEIAGGLYNDTSFVDSLFNGLSEKGVFVVQLGKSKMLTDPPDDIGRFKDTAIMIDELTESGFESIHTYDEGHSHFYMPWSYLVAFKDYKTRTAWHKTAPEIEIELRRRLHNTKSGKPVLRYFDAATMISYQMPSRATETTYCRKEDSPYECYEFVTLKEDEGSQFLTRVSEYTKVGRSSLGGHAGRGLFATRDIPKDSAFSYDEGAKAFNFLPSTWSVISKLEAWADAVSDTIPSAKPILGLYTYVEGYGHGATLLGELHMSVDSGLLFFMNHGCNDTGNYGYIYDEDREPYTEFNVDINNLNLTDIEENLANTAEGPYSPVFDRHWRRPLNSDDYFFRDIAAGEEILTNYLSFVGDPDDFKEFVLELRQVCSGEKGTIAEYESES